VREAANAPDSAQTIPGMTVAVVEGSERIEKVVAPVRNGSSVNPNL